MTKKKRLDDLLLASGLVDNLEKARALIGAGKVLVNGNMVDKAGSLHKQESELRLKQSLAFVSRGGLKLEAGLKAFGIDPRGMICADIGCSTGGFTDCLLQQGATRVYSVDVGYGVLDWKLRGDERVVVLERTNARYLTRELIPDPLDLVVMDASFISLEKLLPPLLPLFGDEVEIVALVKPQFELPREKIAKGGVVREAALHDQALDMVRSYALDTGLDCREVISSPIKGAKGNREFLMHLKSFASRGEHDDFP